MVGIGGSTAYEELEKIVAIAHEVAPIRQEEYQERISKACELLKENSLGAMYLHAGTNLYYFTGLRWNVSERLVGALLFSDGTLLYLAPKFEEGTIIDFQLIEGDILCWEEHENPYQLLVDTLNKSSIEITALAIDEPTPFFVTNGIQKVSNGLDLIDAKSITAGCRMVKSNAEIAIMQHAMNITLKVQQAAARILYEGISTKEVVDFINEAHKRYGVQSGSYFCIVLFGVDSSYPHGVKKPKNLAKDEVVLIDTGCCLYDYISDITRSYVYGDISEEQRKIWNIEKETQLAAFKAAQLGNRCGVVDDASRVVLESYDLGPDYKLPGLPHRTGHGIGLDIHEWPYMVRNEDTLLKPGMCFSIEPMICVPNKFGIRLEDHVFMTEDGPRWFTNPIHSIENPFGI